MLYFTSSAVLTDIHYIMRIKFVNHRADAA